MHRNNFKEMQCISNSNSRISDLGCFIQDLENQLWDGHPHIYPNLRIFLEEWCDLIIDVGIGLKIRDNNNGKTRKEIHQLYDQLIKQKKINETLCGKTINVVKGNWSFSLKIRTVECAFREKGIDTRKWGLSNQNSNNNNDNLKDQLNDRSHKFTPISDNHNKAFAQFEARFGILKIIHDGVYKDFLENVLKIPVKNYVMPNKMEIIEMLNKYNSGLKNNNQ